MSPRTIQMLVTFVIFALVMAGLGWVLKQVVPPASLWDPSAPGAAYLWGALATALLVAIIVVYRGAKTGRSERSLKD